MTVGEGAGAGGNVGGSDTVVVPLFNVRFCSRRNKESWRIMPVTDVFRTRTGGKRWTNLFSICAIVVFSVTWSVGMYVSFRGSLSPHPETGELYPVLINGATIYAKRWEYYLTSPGARTIGILSMALFVYLNWGTNRPKQSDV